MALSTRSRLRGCGMKVRRQVYLDADDNRWLEEESKATRLPVSEIIRQVVHSAILDRFQSSDRESLDVQNHRHFQKVKSRQPRLSWDEYFAKAQARVGATTEENWVHDSLLDSEVDAALDREIDELERRR